MLYVLKMDNPQSANDQGVPTRVQLIGPFPTSKIASSWAKNHNPHGNPLWQVVNLADPVVPTVAPRPRSIQT